LFGSLGLKKREKKKRGLGPVLAITDKKAKHRQNGPVFVWSRKGPMFIVRSRKRGVSGVQAYHRLYIPIP